MTQYQTRNKTQKMALGGIMAALALIFSYIEFLVPFPIGIPGVKLGIANVVVIVALYSMGVRAAGSINLVRIMSAGLLFNGVFGAMYALSGATLSLVVMALLKKSKAFSIVGVSMAGGVAHNLGQVLMAAIMISNIKIMVYFPVLIFSGMITGVLIGIIVYLIITRQKALLPASQN